MFAAMGHVKHIHFVGIGGAGMSGIAEVLCRQGYTVTGSDLHCNALTKHLMTLGIAVKQGHCCDYLANSDVVVVSSAVSSDNPEVTTAMAAGLPVISRAEMLAELVRHYRTVAIAGSHGKTTTTGMISAVMMGAGLDPSYVIGGQINQASSHARLGTSPYFVIEADESDASFLRLNPQISVVTNISNDHLGTYGNDPSQLQQAFLDYLHRLPFYGLAVLCFDDPNLSALLPQVQRNYLTYGFDSGADVRAVDWQQQGIDNCFTVLRCGHTPLPIRMPLPGKHNVLNALAAAAVATELGVDDASLQQSLATFSGMGRRFQRYGEITFPQGKAWLVDDYGHHPQEIEATLAAVRQTWPSQRLVHVFQPHRFSRTQALFEQFAQVLAEADHLLLLDIYSAGEPAVPGITHRALAEQIQSRTPKTNVTCCQLDTLSGHLAQVIRDGDVLLCQGAGSIGGYVTQLTAGDVLNHG